jgi:hypothetical protein
LGKLQVFQTFTVLFAHFSHCELWRKHPALTVPQWWDAKFHNAKFQFPMIQCDSWMGCVTHWRANLDRVECWACFLGLRKESS